MLGEWGLTACNCNTFLTSAAPATGETCTSETVFWVSPQRMWGVRLLNFINIVKDTSHSSDLCASSVNISGT